MFLRVTALDLVLPSTLLFARNAYIAAVEPGRGNPQFGGRCAASSCSSALLPFLSTADRARFPTMGPQAPKEKARKKHSERLGLCVSVLGPPGAAPTNIPVAILADVLCGRISMPPKRARFDGDSDQIKVVLAAHMQYAGAIRYPDGDKPLLDKQRLTREPLRSMLLELRALAPNLCFNKLTMQSAFKALAKEKGWELGSELDEYASLSTERLRNALRHAGQGLLKSRGATWVREIFGDDDDSERMGATRKAKEGKKVVEEAPPAGKDEEEEQEAEREEDEQEEKEEAEPPPRQQLPKAWVYEYHSANHAVFRSIKVGAKVTNKEVSYDIFAEDSGDGVFANFHEGAVRLPRDVMTRDMLVEKQAAHERKRCSSKRSFFWEGIHSVSGEKVWVTRRKDRSGIAVIFETKGGCGNNFVCMQACESIDEQQEEDKYLKALEIMKEVAVLYTTNKVHIDDIYKCRDEVLAEKKWGFRKRSHPMKRPSASARTTADEQGKRPKLIEPLDDVECPEEAQDQEDDEDEEAEGANLSDIEEEAAVVFESKSAASGVLRRPGAAPPAHQSAQAAPCVHLSPEGSDDSFMDLPDFF